MKKILLTLTAVLALALTGCSGSSQASAPVPTVTVMATPEPAPTVTVTAEPEPSSSVLDTTKTSERTFLRALRSQNPDLNEWTDDQVMDLAGRVCLEMAEGADLRDFIMGTLQIKGELYGDTGYGAPLGTVVAGTVMTYCPEYSSDVQELTSP